MGAGDTIVALSSGSPPAAIAVLRLSGPDALAAARAVAGPLPTPRRAGLRALRDGAGDLLDRALVLVFPGPASATGEDLVEFHCHGGRAVVAGVEAALLARAGVRRAVPGEFTRRALANGRIDLIEADGLADLLEAETETQRRAALVAAEGRVSRAVGGWTNAIASLSAEVEAAIDYAGEAEVEASGDTLAGIAGRAAALSDEIAAALAQPAVERWRDGWRVVVAGPPNAGKSTLVNALAARDAAIVSPIAGTTRDRIEVPVRRDGVAYVLVDTAGLRGDPGDFVERIGIDRAVAETARADLLLWLDDAPPPRADALVVVAKADLRGVPFDEWPADWVAAGMADSVERLWGRIAAGVPTLAPDALPMTAGVRDACREAAAMLRDIGDDEVVAAERLRLAAVALAGALGYDATEMMLDALFSRFCLGK